MQITDEQKRRMIPSRADLKTDYQPVGSFLMVIPLEEPEMVGQIFLPPTTRETRQLAMNEGHIVARGPTASDEFQVGDCVSWSSHSEFRVKTDDCKPFVLVQGANIILKINSTTLTMKQ